MYAQKAVQGESKIEIFKTLDANDLNIVVEKQEPNIVGFSTWIRQLLQGWRQGTVACKGRADVSFSNKKPWKQKGTGRARAGSARSPLWRGGGVTFGPQPRTRTLKVSKKLKLGLLNSIFWQFLENDRIRSINWMLNGDVPRTTHAYNTLKDAGLHQNKLVLFLPMDDVLTYASFINIPNIKILFFDEANAFDLVGAHYWIVLNKDVGLFKEMISKWI